MGKGAKMCVTEALITTGQQNSKSSILMLLALKGHVPHAHRDTVPRDIMPAYFRIMWGVKNQTVNDHF